MWQKCVKSLLHHQVFTKLTGNSNKKKTIKEVWNSCCCWEGYPFFHLYSFRVKLNIGISRNLFNLGLSYIVKDVGMKWSFLSMKEGSLFSPARTRDRDYHIGSNFWKFYFNRISFTLREPVSLVKVFRLFRLIGSDCLGVQSVDTIGRCTTYYLLAQGQQHVCDALFCCLWEIHWTGMLQLVFLVSLESSWWGGVPAWAWFHGVWTCSAKVLEYSMISSLKIKLNRN
jgi:hypothetical protein